MCKVYTTVFLGRDSQAEYAVGINHISYMNNTQGSTVNIFVLAYDMQILGIYALFI